MAETQAKRRWAEGDEGWEVEWCKVLPCYEDDPGTIDIDNAEMVTRDFRDKAAAYRYAREVFPKSQTGVVMITPFVLERLCEDDPFHPVHNCHTEYTAESDYIDSDSPVAE